MNIKLSSLVLSNFDGSSFYSIVLNNTERTPPGMYRHIKVIYYSILPSSNKIVWSTALFSLNNNKSDRLAFSIIKTVYENNSSKSETVIQSDFDLSKVGWFSKSVGGFVVNGYILQSSKIEGNVVMKIRKIKCDLIESNNYAFVIKGLSKDIEYKIPQCYGGETILNENPLVIEFNTSIKEKSLEFMLEGSGFFSKSYSIKDKLNVSNVNSYISPINTVFKSEYSKGEDSGAIEVEYDICFIPKNAIDGYSEEKDDNEMEIKQNIQYYGNELIETNRKQTRPYTSLEYLSKSQNIQISVVSVNDTKNANDVVLSYRKSNGYIYIQLYYNYYFIYYLF